MKTILLVDDSKTVIAKLAHGIKSDLKDVNIITAYSYKEAVKHILANEGEIHLAVLDLNLPDAKQGDIVDFTLGKNIPSIVLTGLMNDSIKKFVLEKDILDYFNKQDIVNIQQLTSTIDRALKNYNSNVLIVEDSTTLMGVATSILESMHVNIQKAKNGLEALEILENSGVKFDLVLTDYNMPQMDGMELTIKIREKYKKDQLGVIVFSATDQPEIATKFIKLGANDFINKPYSKMEFITRVNTTLEVLDLFEQTNGLESKDYLTGVYNRKFFFEYGEVVFENAYKEDTSISVAMIDIDEFRFINDTFSYEVGDEVLRECTRIVNENLREKDLIARCNGKTFCVLLENIELDEVKELFEKIRYDLEMNLFKVDNIDISFTVSIGVCYGIKDSLSQMIKVAEEGLDNAKEHGRNQVYVDEPLFM